MDTTGTLATQLARGLEADVEIALAQAVGPGRHLAARTALRDLIRAAG